ncbi:PAAR domain-containing protein [Alphaproteobacteria bacterium KMM 3653]|uniref:PAAR domain-containing protein n=1 Tax=Harenicola maris TaxID=2841044 RepID=A0AAP2CMP9_9RHOB|nr:PAAR domain-containing protein [Harenicola maris]
MSQPAARMSDMHLCPMITPPTPITPPVPHVGGPILTGAPTVLINFLPAARISDTCLCIGIPDVIVAGSPTVHIAAMPAARMGDSTAHGGAISMGSPNVFIGASSSAPSMGLGMGAAAPPGQTDRSVAEAMEALKLTSGNPDPGTPHSPAFSSGPALSQAAAQAAALIEAAKTGAPFCEKCARAAEEEKRQRRAQAKARRDLQAEMDADSAADTGGAT